MVLAHSGQMDHASALVRRSLFALESAYSEPFRGGLLRSASEGGIRSRLDGAPDSGKANAVYWAALFRHMQMTGMMGCTRTALEVSRLILSLDPVGDPMAVLLCIDYYALASKQPKVLQALLGSNLPVGYSPHFLEENAPDVQDEAVSYTHLTLPTKA